MPEEIAAALFWVASGLIGGIVGTWIALREKVVRASIRSRRFRNELERVRPHLHSLQRIARELVLAKPHERDAIRHRLRLELLSTDVLPSEPHGAPHPQAKPVREHTADDTAHNSRKTG